jgi:hypothetical protein
VANAFGHTFAWAAAITGLALLAVIALVRAERAELRGGTLAATASHAG